MGKRKANVLLKKATTPATINVPLQKMLYDTRVSGSLVKIIPSDTISMIGAVSANASKSKRVRPSNASTKKVSRMKYSIKRFRSRWRQHDRTCSYICSHFVACAFNKAIERQSQDPGARFFKDVACTEWSMERFKVFIKAYNKGEIYVQRRWRSVLGYMKNHGEDEHKKLVEKLLKKLAKDVSPGSEH